MIINCISEFLPEKVVANSYFKEKYGISEDEIISKSGIRQRRYVQPYENTNTMAIEAVKKGLNKLPFNINDIDLFIGASYTLMILWAQSLMLCSRTTKSAKQNVLR
jgi:3-oxoacyl-[acyl-carrier-protein] synthase-3